MKIYSELLKQINEAIANIQLPSIPEGLYEPVSYSLSMGGKRLRPVLLLLAYQMYQEHYEKVLQAALGIETYHNYTLLHDDLMDKADMRRGKPTVHRCWNANTAILSGDSMLVLSCKMIMSVESPKNIEVMNLFLNTALEIGEGQQFDMNFETRMDVSEDEYIEMIRLKTSVLLACALKMGAVLGGAADNEADILYKFGESLGLAFQLQDDLLDVYGDPSVFGKKIGGDILCNKKTFLLINAIQKANPRQSKELMKWINLDDYDEQEKIDSITSIYNELSIRQLTESRIAQYFNQAYTYLSQLNLPEERKAPLWQYAQSLLGRNS